MTTNDEIIRFSLENVMIFIFTVNIIIYLLIIYKTYLILNTHMLIELL